MSSWRVAALAARIRICPLMAEPAAESLRARQRRQLTGEIRSCAVRLFAERGFEVVTAEQIAEAAGISTSTFFRHVPSKEALLVEPLLAGISGIVAAFEARPADENAATALAAATVDSMTPSSTDDVDVWLAAIRNAPQLINRITLVSPADRDRLADLAAARMGGGRDAEFRATLLVQVLLAASEHVFRTWVAEDGKSVRTLAKRVAEALRLVLEADW